MTFRFQENQVISPSGVYAIEFQSVFTIEFRITSESFGEETEGLPLRRMPSSRLAGIQESTCEDVLLDNVLILQKCRFGMGSTSHMVSFQKCLLPIWSVFEEQGLEGSSSFFRNTYNTICTSLVIFCCSCATGWL